MDVLVMLDEAPDHSAELLPVAQVNTGRVANASETWGRDVVRLYGVPSAETLALALAAALESQREARAASQPHEQHSLGVFADQGAIGDAAWRDQSTGQLLTRNLEIPLAVLIDTSATLLVECGQTIRRLLAGLLMPDWPEGAARAITFSFGAGFTGAAMPAEGMLALLRESDGLDTEQDEETAA